MFNVMIPVFQDGYNPCYMKQIMLVLIGLLVISACNSGFESGGTTARLTPYQTQPALTEPAQADAAESTATPVPVPTPTPVVHIVSLGETISSIALQYGVSIDAILNANPGISPNAMIVGEEVIVPAGESASTISIDASIAGAIVPGKPYCVQSGGGLWCSVMVENRGEKRIIDTVISISFSDGEGNSILAKNVPTVLRRLDPESVIPAALFLIEPPADYETVEVSMFSARGLPDGDQTAEVIEEERDVVLEPLQAEITGTMRVAAGGESDRATVSIAAAALNMDGDVIGVRRQDITVAIEESFAFSITVYSSGDDIAEIILFSEVN